jgi:hypothetical protein
MTFFVIYMRNFFEAFLPPAFKPQNFLRLRGWAWS